MYPKAAIARFSSHWLDVSFSLSLPLFLALLRQTKRWITNASSFRPIGYLGVVLSPPPPNAERSRNPRSLAWHVFRLRGPMHERR